MSWFSDANSLLEDISEDNSMGKAENQVYINLSKKAS